MKYIEIDGRGYVVMGCNVCPFWHEDVLEGFDRKCKYPHDASECDEKVENWAFPSDCPLKDAVPKEEEE